VSNALRADILQGLTELCDRSRISGLCANCNFPIEGELHMCDPDKASQVMMSSAWRYLLDSTSPMKRACTYSVK
jgi:hypothetical protein